MTIIVECEGRDDAQAHVDTTLDADGMVAELCEQLTLPLPAEAYGLRLEGELLPALPGQPVEEQGLTGSGERVEIVVRPQWTARVRLDGLGVTDENRTARFHQAVDQADLAAVRLFMEAADVDPTAVTDVLSAAARAGDAELVKALISGNVRCDMHLALLNATRARRHDITDALIEAGANINYARHGESCFIVTVEQCAMDRVEMMIDEHGADVDMLATYGFTPLMIAATKRRMDLAKLLLARGANVNAVGHHGYTCLMVAAQKGELALLALFADHGADITARGRRGDTCLYIAAKGHADAEALPCALRGRVRHRGEHDACVRYIMDAAGKRDLFTTEHYEDVLRKMCRLGHVDAVALLHDQGVSIECPDVHRGETPILSAVQNGHLPVVEYLVEHGADVNRVERFGDTCLALAARRGYTDVAAFLVRHGCDAAVRDCDGDTALIVAARRGHLSIVKLLIEAGCDPLVKNNNGVTCHDAAVRGVRRDVVRYLQDELHLTTDLILPPEVTVAPLPRRGDRRRRGGKGHGDGDGASGSNAPHGADAQQTQGGRGGGYRGGKGANGRGGKRGKGVKGRGGRSRPQDAPDAGGATPST